MADRLVILPIDSASERMDLIKFQWEVYKGDPYWVPPIISDKAYLLDPAGHPFHQHAKVQYFLAKRGDKIVGTIAGIVNHNHNSFWDEKTGFFGFYEVLRDREASNELLRAAEAFVRDHGMDTIRGPVNFSTNEECGLLVDGWNGPPVIMMTYNPRYYVDYIEGEGYGKAQDLLAYLTDLTTIEKDNAGISPKVFRVANKISQRMDLTFRFIDMHNFDEEAEAFKKIYNNAWAKNWGFVPLTDAELDYEAKSLKTILDPRVTTFAIKDGKAIGAGIPLPDLNQPLLKAYPRPGVPEWWTMVKLLYYWKVRKTVTTLRGFAGGVIEEFRGRGFDAVLAVETLKRS
ncbi:MAG: N-acetyltransferase, partial [Anaerolineae bacterium]|nr:N-acetyltransferase [Anaerolineae bacterium]